MAKLARALDPKPNPNPKLNPDPQQDGVKAALRALRGDYRKSLNWVARTRKDYLEILRAPNAERQKLVHAFQAMFNAIDMEVGPLHPQP